MNGSQQGDLRDGVRGFEPGGFKNLRGVLTLIFYHSAT